MAWETVTENILVFRDVLCNVYLLRDGSSGILFETGSGAVFSALGAAGVDKVDYVFLSHHHRDVAAAAGEIEGITVFAPEGEARFLSGADDFWDAYKPYVRYDLAGDEYTPAEPVGVEPLMAGRVFHWRGWDIECHHTPGHTRHSFSFLAKRGGTRAAFTGDLLDGLGRTWRIYDLAWNYMPPPTGAVAALESSIPLLLSLRPTHLLPSHGPWTAGPETALETFKTRLRNLVNLLEPNRPTEKRKNQPMHRILPHLYFLGGTTYLLTSDSGKGLIYDWGYIDTSVLDRVYEELGVEEIEVVSFSHFHEDHVLRFTELCYCDHRHHPGEIPGRRFLRRPEVWVHSVLKDVLERPWNHHLPCLWPHPVPVDRTFSSGETTRWREFDLTFLHIPGQTWFHQGMLAEVDGKRVLFGGDSFWPPGPDPEHLPNAPVILRNDYRPETGYPFISEILETCEPDLILPSHYDPIHVTDAYLDAFGKWAGLIRPALEELAGAPAPMLSTNPHWAAARPYHLLASPGETVEVRAEIRNPFPRETTVRAAFLSQKEWLQVLRPGGRPPCQAVFLEPGESAVFPQRIRVPSVPGRTVLLMEVWLDDRPQGAPREILIEVSPRRERLPG